MKTEEKYMRKTIFILAAIALLLVSCDNLETDLPTTDVNKYITGSNVNFPKGTKAIDIYNTIVYLYPTNASQYQTVTSGTLKYMRNPINNTKIGGTDNPTGIDENPYGAYNKIEETRSFTDVKHTRASSDPEIHDYIVYLNCPRVTNITLSDAAGTQADLSATEIKLMFRWQRQTTNVHKNDELGKAILTMVVEGLSNNGTPYNLSLDAIPLEITFTK
jgi:hypothetical protein